MFISCISMSFVMTGVGLALDGDWISALTVPVAFVGGVIGLWTARQKVARLKQRIQPVLPSLKQYGAMTYLLYLRPFAEDVRLAAIDPLDSGKGRLPYGRMLGFADSQGAEDSWEEQIVGVFQRCGRVVTVGRPDEEFAFPGAKRFYLRHEDWRQEVSTGIQRARLVLLVAGIGENIRGADGTLWEFTEAVRVLPPARILLLVCGGPDDYRRFRAACAGAFAERAERLRRVGEPPLAVPVLPDHPELGHARRRHPLRGVVQFDEDWRGEFVAFDPAVEPGRTENRRNRAMLRRRIEPFMARLEARLPGEVTPAKSFRWVFAARWIWDETVIGCGSVYLMSRVPAPFTMKAVWTVFAASVAVGSVRTMLSEERLRVRKNVKVVPPPPPPTVRSARFAGSAGSAGSAGNSHSAG
ncbi:hypothetical protein VR41_06735 [Streptomyces sp. NRRL B-1568]|nr:hypothetical protein VR41_06735 [Streptomyces sp. NRRL B-1568]